MKNKLIIFIGTLQSGGAERVVSEISSMYAGHFQEVVILTYYNAKVFYKIDSRVRLECVEKQTKTHNLLKNAFWIRHFVKKEKPDTFLSFLLPFNILAIWVLLFLKIPIAVCERSDPKKVGTSALRLVRNLSYHFCNKIQVQTNAGKAYFSFNLQKKVLVIPNPNHVSIEERIWALTQQKEDRIVTVGRLIPEKNHELLIDAFAIVNKDFPHYVLEFFGDGKLKEVLQNRIRELGLKDSVVLHGNVNDIPRQIASAKMFVLSSDIEGMPNALMEAMALGLPCVATDVSGVRDIITEGENGFIVPVGNKEAMVDRITKLIESEELRNGFAEKTVSVISKFDKEKIFNQWLELVN